MKAMMVIWEPSAYQLLADETRRKILYLLRVKEMNVNQIAQELGITSQAIYHHIRLLLKGKMIEVVREERIGHLIESYYRATAEDFLLSSGKISSKKIQSKKLAIEQGIAVLNVLNKLGFELEFDEEKIRQLVELRSGINECCPGPKKVEIEDQIWNIDELDFPTKLMASGFVDTLLMSDKEFAKQLESRKKIRELLLSMRKEQKA